MTPFASSVVTFLGLFAVLLSASCPHQYSDWERLNDTFSQNHLITICDKRFRGGSIYKKVKKKYSRIDCYVNDKSNELYSCRFHHLYATFLEHSNSFTFTAYCVIAKETKKYLQFGVKFRDKTIQTLNELFGSLRIAIDEVNPPPKYSASYINIHNQNVWYHDTMDGLSRCLSHIPSMPQYKPNAFHCLAALSLLFIYQHILNESRQYSTYYAPVPKSMLNDNTLQSLLKPYFAEIVTLDDTALFGDGEDIYIKELRYNAKDWITNSLYTNHPLFTECADQMPPSQRLIDMADIAATYWSGIIDFETKQNWLHKIDANRQMNGFEIYAKYKCLGVEAVDTYFHSMEMHRNIMFVAHRYVKDKCAEKECMSKAMIDKLVFNGHLTNIDLIIIGNPSLLSFELECTLFKHVSVLIGMSHPMMSVAVLFMEENSLLLEFDGVVQGASIPLEQLAKMKTFNYFKVNTVRDITKIVND